jgi:hypothetical protein
LARIDEFVLESVIVIPKIRREIDVVPEAQAAEVDAGKASIVEPTS